MLDEMQRQMKAEILSKFGMAQAQSLGLIAPDARFDSREIRLEAAHEDLTIRHGDEGGRNDMDDDLTQTRRDFEERIATQYLHTDGAKAEVLKKLERDRKQSAWMEKFRQQRFNAANAHTDGESDTLEAARLAAERRINGQWRPK